MELRQIRYFITVARHRSFTKASSELNIAQSAVSQQIKALEEELNVQLLARTTRSVRLTEAGELFLARGTEILASVQDARTQLQNLAGLVDGRVVIGSVPSLGESIVPEVLARFHAHYPRIELLLREHVAEELPSRLLNEELDLAFFPEPQGGVPMGLDTQMILNEELVLAVPAAHELAHRVRVPLERLRDEPLIVKPGAGFDRMVIEAANKLGFMPRIAFECDQLSTMRALVARGLGVAVMPRTIAPDGSADVAVVRLGPPTITRTNVLAWNADREAKGAAGALLAFAKATTRA